MTTFNFDDLPEETGPEPHPEGEHTFEITEIEENVSQSGLPYLNFTLTNVETNRLVWDMLMLKGKTAKTTINIWHRIRALLTAIKFEIPQGEFDVNWEELKGSVFCVSIVHKNENYIPKGSKTAKEVVRARVNWFTIKAFEGEKAVKEEADEDIPF